MRCKLLQIHEGSVKDNHISGFKRHLHHLFYFMTSGRSDSNKLRDIARVIQFNMNLDPAFGLSKLRPVVERKTQVYCRRIKAVQIILEPKLMSRSCTKSLFQ